VDEKDIIDGLKPICLCKGIKKRVFLQHIAAGIKTVAGLKKATGAGTGSCGGKRCTPRIAGLLENR
jgi:NAD(P)H-nitrite reductase large subunit